MSREDDREEALAIVNYFSGERARDAKEEANAPMSSGQLFDLIDEVRKAGLTVEQAQILKDAGLIAALFRAVRNDPDWLRRREVVAEISHPLGLDRYWIDVDDFGSYSHSCKDVAQHPTRVQGKILWNPDEFDVVQWKPSEFTQRLGPWYRLVTPPGILWPASLIPFLLDHPQQLPEQYRDKEIWFWTAFTSHKREFPSGYLMSGISYRSSRVVRNGLADFLDKLEQPHWVAVKKEVALPAASAT